MVRMRYLGLANPDAAFDALRPAHTALSDMLLRYRPMGPEYRAISAALDSLKEAADTVTGKPDFFGKALDTGCIGTGHRG